MEQYQQKLSKLQDKYRAQDFENGLTDEDAKLALHMMVLIKLKIRKHLSGKFFYDNLTTLSPIF